MWARASGSRILVRPGRPDRFGIQLFRAATADPPAAVLTGRTSTTRTSPGVIGRPHPAANGDMVRVSIAGHPLTATAALVWNGDPPRPLQQILFDTADSITFNPAATAA